MADKLKKYEPPTWASKLTNVPTGIVKLAVTPTPINEWKMPRTPDGFQMLIKRDDLTGCALSGNKVRRLEFILADAIQKNCHHIFTSGLEQSNHCRATAVSCAILGLKSHLLLRSDTTDLSQVKYEGNMLLNRMVGANMYYLPKDDESMFNYMPRMEQLAKQIEEETGQKSYTIPIGGSNPLGTWGYIECFEEIRQQGVEFDDIVCVNSSGGMAAGLAISNYLTGSRYRIHTIATNKFQNDTDMVGFINTNLDLMGLTDVRGDDMIQVYEDYIGLGYGISQPFELEFIAEVAEQTGIILDNTYTGKTAYGLSDLLQKRPEVFKGRRILFVHSGGSLGLQAEEHKRGLLLHINKGKMVFCP